jgi:hypothetical protein
MSCHLMVSQTINWIRACTTTEPSLEFDHGDGGVAACMAEAQAFVRETGHGRVLRGGQIDAETSRSVKGSAVSSSRNYSLALCIAMSTLPNVPQRFQRCARRRVRATGPHKGSLAHRHMHTSGARLHNLLGCIAQQSLFLIDAAATQGLVDSTCRFPLVVTDISRWEFEASMGDAG